MSLSPEKASSSSSSKANSTSKWNFQVFLSFRGEDTRRGFTDHLYSALCRKGLKAFRDDEEVERGGVISEKLLKAIENSLSAIVVLSKNYASSSWCLEELQKILASRNESGQLVFPIFYDVDPSDVRHQKGSFADAFTKHEEKFKDDPEKVRNWRDSLTKVANLSGWDCKDWHEAELIENVIKVLWCNLRFKLPSYDDMLVGIDIRMDSMSSLLGIGFDEVRFVGIWGMGGVGKTTLANLVYKRFLDEFEICCFLGNVREVSEGHDGLIHLQEKFLSHFKLKDMVIENTYVGKNHIQSFCCSKKVFLVLDDVNLINQLENLAGSEDWFGAGSRVIITTRDIHLLISHGVHNIYEAEIMNKDESLELFSMRAFRREEPKEEYLELSKFVIKYAGGLPLALQVLGSFLCGRGVPEWEDTLDKLKQVPDKDIFKILKISYDGLEDSERIIFLDIACFFKMWDKDQVSHILKICGHHPTIGVRRLIEQSLLIETEINGSIHIDMHDLIQDMGRSIVFRESPNDVGKRSRLWSPMDIDQALKRNMGTEVIQGLVLPNNFLLYNAYCDPKAFSKMTNLRLLIICWNLNLPYGLKCLPNALKFLLWHWYPLEALPLGTQLDELVYLEMHNSKIKQLWNGIGCLEKLKYMDLSHSKYLIRTPDFSEVPNLEKLILEGCTDLVEIHPLLGQHKNLVVLNLKGCTNLKAFPRTLEMASLKEFVLCGCTKVRKLPEFGENMKNLVILDLEETSIVKLPASLGFLTGLEDLNLKRCKNLVCLPHTINNLKHLKILDISCCLKFSKLPDNLNENEALEKLGVNGTAIIELPSSIGHLQNLKTLSLFPRHSFPRRLLLPTSIFNLKSLTELDLSYCSIDDGFIPNDLSSLSSLQHLDLSGNKFVNLPIGCVANLLKLSRFYLNFCTRLQSLPQLSPGLIVMKAEGCTSIEALSDEQVAHLFALVDKRGQYARGLSYISPDANIRASLAMDTFSATIPGSEIPSWFHNQNYLSLNQKGKASIIIDMPPCEWQEFALCIVLDDMFYYTEWNLPFWDYHISRASDKAFATIGGNAVHLEKGINYPHLWILVSHIREKNGLELSMKYKQLCLEFTAGYEFGVWGPQKKVDGIISVKCGWRVMSRVDFESHLPILEEHKEGENGICSETNEQGQCSLPPIESSQIIINECETMSSEASSSSSEEEGKSDDSWMQFIPDDARFWF